MHMELENKEGFQRSPNPLLLLKHSGQKSAYFLLHFLPIKEGFHYQWLIRIRSKRFGVRTLLEAFYKCLKNINFAHCVVSIRVIKWYSMPEESFCRKKLIWRRTSHLEMPSEKCKEDYTNPAGHKTISLSNIQICCMIQEIVMPTLQFSLLCLYF